MGKPVDVCVGSFSSRFYSTPVRGKERFTLAWTDPVHGRRRETFGNFELANYCKGRGWLPKDFHPLDGLKKRKSDSSEIAIWTPEELAALPVELPYPSDSGAGDLCVLGSPERGGSALGLARDQDVGRVCGGSGNQGQEATRRLAPCRVNLAARLTPRAKAEGPLWPANEATLHEDFRRAAAAAGLTWRDNALLLRDQPEPERVREALILADHGVREAEAWVAGVVPSRTRSTSGVPAVVCIRRSVGMHRHARQNAVETDRPVSSTLGRSISDARKGSCQARVEEGAVAVVGRTGPSPELGGFAVRRMGRTGGDAPVSPGVDRLREGPGRDPTKAGFRF